MVFGEIYVLFQSIPAFPDRLPRPVWYVSLPIWKDRRSFFGTVFIWDVTYTVCLSCDSVCLCVEEVQDCKRVFLATGGEHISHHFIAVLMLKILKLSVALNMY